MGGRVLQGDKGGEITAGRLHEYAMNMLEN